MSITISLDPARQDLDAIHRMLAGTYWSPGIRRDVVTEARRLIEELERHPELKTLRRWCLATRDAHGLYRKFGYQPVPTDRWMERVGPKDAWQVHAAANDG